MNGLYSLLACSKRPGPDPQIEYHLKSTAVMFLSFFSDFVKWNSSRLSIFQMNMLGSPQTKINVNAEQFVAAANWPAR